MRIMLKKILNVCRKLSIKKREASMLNVHIWILGEGENETQRRLSVVKLPTYLIP